MANVRILRLVPFLLSTACGATTSHPETDEPAVAAGSTTAPGATAAAARTKVPVDYDETQLGATRSMLARSAAIVEGIVIATSHSFDQRLGPRTIYTFEITKTLAGSSQGETTELAEFGGTTPSGKGVSTSLTVNLVEGERYVLFLSSEAWFFEPWVGDPLRVATLGNREVLVGPHGKLLTGVQPGGFRYGQRFDPAGYTRPRDPSRAGPLSYADFVESLEEAMDLEAVRPSGSFSGPQPRGDDWRVRQ